MKKILFLLPLFLFCVPAFAQEDADLVTTEHYIHNVYPQAKRQFMAQFDGCDLINARDILTLGTQPLTEKQLPGIRDLFYTTLEARLECYEQSKEKLHDLLTDSYAYLNMAPENTLFQRQHELDRNLLEMLDIRRNISHNLLTSLLNDIDTAFADTTTTDAAIQGVFFNESKSTRKLFKEETHLVLEMERRQLELDELNMTSGTAELPHITEIKLKKAHHHIARALFHFEEIVRTRPQYALAQLNSDVSYARTQLQQIMAFDPQMKDLKPSLRQEISTLDQQLSLQRAELTTTLSYLKENTFKADFDTWLAERYDSLNDLSAQIHAVLRQGTSFRVAYDNGYRVENLPPLPATPAIEEEPINVARLETPPVKKPLPIEGDLPDLLPLSQQELNELLAIEPAAGPTPVSATTADLPADVDFFIKRIQEEIPGTEVEISTVTKDDLPTAPQPAPEDFITKEPATTLKMPVPRPEKPTLKISGGI